MSKSTPPPADASAKTSVRSMTGYGRAALEEGRRVTAEVRSVNGKFLKVSVKVMGRFGALEDRVKQFLTDAGIKRGSVDVSLFFEGASEEGSYGIDAVAIQFYVKQARAIAKKNKLKSKLSIESFLTLPGVVRRQDPGEDIEEAWTLAKKALDEALKAFASMREREGAAIAADIRGHLNGLKEHQAAIRIAAPEALKAGVQKYKERIARLLEQAQVSAPMNPDVLERETILMSDRTDVSEELARLQSHFEQIDATLNGGGETGRKLDFLTQELFRETNTIGSKTNDERISHRVVDMKGLIEKIREQVQNLE